MLLGSLLGSNFTDGILSMALQQGGMGLILTTLILTAPPMAAMFFQGTLGNFMAYSQIGGSAVATTPGPSGQPPGSYVPENPGASTASSDDNARERMPRLMANINDLTPAGARGNANGQQRI